MPRFKGPNPARYYFNFIQQLFFAKKLSLRKTDACVDALQKVIIGANATLFVLT